MTNWMTNWILLRWRRASEEIWTDLHTLCVIRQQNWGPEGKRWYEIRNAHYERTDSIGACTNRNQ